VKTAVFRHKFLVFLLLWSFFGLTFQGLGKGFPLDPNMEMLPKFLRALKKWSKGVYEAKKILLFLGSFYTEGEKAIYLVT